MKNKFTFFLILYLFISLNCDELQIKKLELIQELSRITNNKSNDSISEPEKLRKMTINSDFHITGSLTANYISCESSTISGNLNVSKVLKSKEITTDKLTTNTLITEKIVSPTGVLTLSGDLVINNDILADNIAVRGSSFVLDNVRQWGLVHHDDFESNNSLDGWSDKRVSRCKEGGNTFLGGHCNFSYNEVTKVFKNLPTHTKLRINAGYHMLDSWEGEMGYMKLDDEIAWSKTGQYSEKGLDFCGGGYNDPAFNIHIDVTIPHNKTELKITFGSTLDEEPCNESFGIDDVMIYVR